jgi:precorrin-6A synthase
MRTIHVIGIGAGDPDYVTTQAIRALNDTDVFFAMDKGDSKSDLVELRREICRRFITEPGYRFVELPDPPRAAVPNPPVASLLPAAVPNPGDDYTSAVLDWHAARARLWANAIEKELDPGGVGAFLAWGDPSLYDSTLRILDQVAEHVDLRYDVIPGITAVQALTARHRIPLNDIGEPVLITTGRQLRATGLVGSAVVMLDGDCAFLGCPPGTRIWWGAYLGTPDELLVAGTVGEVGERIASLRAEARARHGWIMDTYLLRA